MKKEKKIYIITTIRFGFKYANSRRSRDGIFRSYRKRISKSQTKYLTIISDRTWGWFTKLATAKKCVEENWGDIYEGEYFAAVIEEVPEGVVINIPTNEWWYKWEGSWEKGRYKPWKKPKAYKNIVGFYETPTKKGADNENC